MIILVLIGFSIIAIIDFVPLYKQGKWRDFWVALGLGACTLILASLIALNQIIPSPEKPIREVITAIFGE